jgi:hypothetical protein
MPDTPGRRLKVFTAGLHQLGARCQSLDGTLSAEAVPSFVAASSWQSNAGAVNLACAGSRTDLTALAGRAQASGTKYSAVGTDYTETDEDGAGRFRGLAV